MNSTIIISDRNEKIRFRVFSVTSAILHCNKSGWKYLLKILNKLIEPDGHITSEEREIFSSILAHIDIYVSGE